MLDAANQARRMQNDCYDQYVSALVHAKIPRSGCVTRPKYFRILSVFAQDVQNDHIP